MRRWPCPELQPCMLSDIAEEGIQTGQRKGSEESSPGRHRPAASTADAASQKRLQLPADPAASITANDSSIWHSGSG
ncbi:hypothetical protein WJX73_008532 [Symbiochloris irregularis]|uniref:Uncharacterized protein n=1 Tax=Symbiochloris irregularis TaxID=706552 RepID=A0AAW1NQM7_9CHLO